MAQKKIERRRYWLYVDGHKARYTVRGVHIEDAADRVAKRWYGKDCTAIRQSGPLRGDGEFQPYQVCKGLDPYPRIGDSFTLHRPRKGLNSAFGYQTLPANPPVQAKAA